VTPDRAAYFGRCALMPRDEFAPVADRNDATLAEVFDVPLEHVRQPRGDVAEHVWTDPVGAAPA